MDFVLEMYAEDHPDELEFLRGGQEKPLSGPETAAQWEQRLRGKARDAFLGVRMPSAAVLVRIREMAGANAVLTRAATAPSADVPLPPEPSKRKGG